MTISITHISGGSEDDSRDQLIVTQSLAPALRYTIQVIIGLDNNDGAPHHSLSGNHSSRQEHFHDNA
jgi:hypothetical protein